MARITTHQLVNAARRAREDNPNDCQRTGRLYHLFGGLLGLLSDSEKARVIEAMGFEDLMRCAEKASQS